MRRAAPLDLRQRIARNVVRLRSVRGWSQQEAADRAGMSRPGYEKIEYAVRGCGLATLAALAQGLDVDPTELVAATMDGPSVVEMIDMIVQLSVDGALGEMARQAGPAPAQLALESRGAGLRGAVHIRARLIAMLQARGLRL